MMSVGELSTAVSLNLHITILIMNDNKYGMIRWKQVSLRLQHAIAPASILQPWSLLWCYCPCKHSAAVVASLVLLGHLLTQLPLYQPALCLLLMHSR